MTISSKNQNVLTFFGKQKFPKVIGKIKVWKETQNSIKILQKTNKHENRIKLKEIRRIENSVPLDKNL